MNQKKRPAVRRGVRVSKDWKNLDHKASADEEDHSAECPNQTKRGRFREGAYVNSDIVEEDAASTGIAVVVL